MKYFGRALHEAINSTSSSAIVAAIDEFQKHAVLYREHLIALRPRLSPNTQRFFETVSLHDGTLQRMSVGDDIAVALPAASRGAFVNRRKLSVLLEVLDAQGKRRHALRYKNIRRVVFDYPSAEPWYMRYSQPGTNPIDDWLADELTAADDKFLRHEVLFSSGTTLLVEFTDVSIRSISTASATRR